MKPVTDGAQLSSERCNAYIDTIQQALDNSLSTTGNLSPDRSVVDALTQLHASVEGVPELAELVAPLQSMIGGIERVGGTFNAADTLLVQEAVIAVTLGVDSIAHGAPMPELIADVTARVLHAADQVELQCQPGGLDHALLDTFIEEATDRLQQLYELFQRWLAAPRSGGRRVSSICRSLHSLKGAADSVGLEAFAALVHRLESAVDAYDADSETQVDDFFEVSFNVLEALVDDVDNLRTGGAVAEHEHWLQQLARWSETLATDSVDPQPEDPAAGELTIDHSGVVDAARLRSLRHAYGVAAGKVVESRVSLHRATEQARAISAIHSRLSNLGGTEGATRATSDPGYSRALQDSARLQAGLAQSLENLDQSLRVQALHLDRVQQQLEQESLVPLDRLEQRLATVARQVATAEGKQVEVEFVSDVTELPSELLAAIASPLEQLVRNAVVHGIESEEVRAAAGKSREGRLTVHLRGVAAGVQVAIADDGRGVDFPRLKHVLQDQRQSGVELSDQSAMLAQLVRPGLSTSSDSTVASGHGNGLDSVLATVAELGGSLGVSTSTSQGTRFEMVLPLSRWEAVTTVQVGSAHFGILQRDLLPEAGLAASIAQSAALGDLLGIGRSAQAAGPERLVARVRSEAIELFIDRIVGVASTRVLPGGHLLRNTRGYSGVIVGQAELPVPVLDIEYWVSASKTTVISRPDKPVVLVVEDSSTMRGLISRALSTVHCECLFAHDAVEAAEVLARCVPALVLLDIKLPRGDGTSVARELRARGGRYAQLPIVFTTSIARHVIVDLLVEVAPAGYLEKPYTADEVARLVAGLLSQALTTGPESD